MMEQQTQLKCEVYDLQKKLEAMKKETELKCEVADLMKVIRRYQETWVDGALVEAEKKAVQDYIAELKREIVCFKKEEKVMKKDLMKYGPYAYVLSSSEEEEEEPVCEEVYVDFDYEGVAYLLKDGIFDGARIYNTNFEEVGTWDGHKIDWTSYDACQRHKEERDDTDEEEEVVEVPAWRKIENAFHLGRVDGGRAHASSLETARERCLKLNLAGFTYNHQTKWIFFHKTIDPSQIVKTSWHKNNSGVYQKYTKWQWCDMYINCE